MYKGILGIVLAMFCFFGCSSQQSESRHPLAHYFYPISSTPSVYVYRDIIGGLDEQFHRVYCVTDQLGKHLVVERYASDGRILEALNFNVDSLDIQDHMVVNRAQKKTKAILYKTTFFPWGNKGKSWFASKFEGVLDSTLILQDIKRSVLKTKVDCEVLGNKTPCLALLDSTRYSLLNPFTQREKILTEISKAYYAEGIGLVEWKGSKNKVHFKLEQIMSQEDWLKIIGR